jgi:hypothetical protein
MSARRSDSEGGLVFFGFCHAAAPVCHPAYRSAILRATSGWRSGRQDGEVASQGGEVVPQQGGKFGRSVCCGNFSAVPGQGIPTQRNSDILAVPTAYKISKTMITSLIDITSICNNHPKPVKYMSAKSIQRS